MADSESPEALIDPQENGVNSQHSQTYSNDPDRMRVEDNTDQPAD